MSAMMPVEQDAAERRLKEIQVESQRVLVSTTHGKEREDRWFALLPESLNLQELLDGDEPQKAAGMVSTIPCQQPMTLFASC